MQYCTVQYSTDIACILTTVYLSTSTQHLISCGLFVCVDHQYVISLLFLAKVALLTLLSCIPLVLITIVVGRLCPSYGKKLEHVN